MHGGGDPRGGGPRRDWQPYDIDWHAKLEVRQSAAKQLWPQPKGPKPPTFSIKKPQFEFDGTVNRTRAGQRQAEVYVFAYHPVFELPLCDQRDEGQWEFYVLPTRRLPNQKTIGLRRLRKMARPCQYRALGESIRRAAWEQSTGTDAQ